MGKRPPLDEWLSLFQSTIAAEGITTAAGAVAGTSIIDAALIGAGANSFFTMMIVLYPGQPLLVDSQDITDFNTVTGEVIYAGAYKGVAAAIPAGVPYKIVTFKFVPAEVAAVLALVTTMDGRVTAVRAGYLDLILPTLYASGTQATVITTEHFLSSPAVAGRFTLHVDKAAMAANDVLELRVYQMVLTGGASRVAHFMTYYGAQPADELIAISPKISNDLVEANALRFSLTQTFGVGRDFPWKVLRT